MALAPAAKTWPAVPAAYAWMLRKGLPADVVKYFLELCNWRLVANIGRILPPIRRVSEWAEEVYWDYLAQRFGYHRPNYGHFPDMLHDPDFVRSSFLNNSAGLTIEGQAKKLACEGWTIYSQNCSGWDWRPIIAFTRVSRCPTWYAIYSIVAMGYLEDYAPATYSRKKRARGLARYAWDLYKQKMGNPDTPLPSSGVLRKFLHKEGITKSLSRDIRKAFSYGPPKFKARPDDLA